jgi:hypothetical protein
MSRPRQLMDAHEAISLLTAKTSEQVTILQDIWFLAFDYPCDADTRRTRISQAIDLLELFPSWTRRAIETRQILVQYLIQAFYEMAYGAMRAFGSLPPRIMRGIIDKIFRCWDDLLELLIQPRHPDVSEWEYYLFSVIGYAMPLCQLQTQSMLKARVAKSLLKFLTFVRNRNDDPNDHVPSELYDYLQLVGAWSAAFLSEETLAREIASMLAQSYPRRDPFYGSSEPFGSLGYPTLHHGDFFLPNLMNIRTHVSQEQWKEFQDIQNRVMDPEILVPYADSIRALAEPRSR